VVMLGVAALGFWGLLRDLFAGRRPDDGSD